MNTVGAVGGGAILPAATFTSEQAAAMLRQQQQAMSALEQQISSGLRFSKPSDDPTGVVQAMQLRSALARSQSYSATITSATGLVTQASNVLSQAGTQLQQLRTIVLQAMSTTNQAPTALASAAAQVSAIATTLQAGAATTFQGQPIFGTGVQQRAVGPGQTVPVGISADTAYGGGSSGSPALFDVVNQIAADLTAGPTAWNAASSADLDALDAATDRLNQAAATVGVQMQSLQAFATQATSRQTALTAQLSAVQDVDPAAAIVALQQAQNDYQTSMWATSQVLSQSLVEFLS